MFYVYILYSRKLKKYYVGSTNDIVDRLSRHNAGQGNYTRKGIPWVIIWSQEKDTRSEALSLEKKIKKRGISRYLVDNQSRVE